MKGCCFGIFKECSSSVLLRIIPWEVPVKYCVKIQLYMGEMVFSFRTMKCRAVIITIAYYSMTLQNYGINCHRNLGKGYGSFQAKTSLSSF